MRGVFGEFDFGGNSLSFLFLLFLVFYLTPVVIFVNRLALPAKSCRLAGGNDLTRQTPE
jgi:hypothetical protein